MKWPWVSRAHADQMIDTANLLCRSADQEIIQAQERTQRAEKRFDDLLAKYQSLKLAGAVEVPSVDLPRAIVQRPADELRELIDAKAGTDLRRRKMMLRQLTADRAAGVNDDEIREAILNGIPSEGVPG
jgi:alkylhydroperoxidase/carboxymuconolactone decarboxylase family protein YurZ